MTDLGFSAADETALLDLATRLSALAWKINDNTVQMSAAERKLAKSFKAKLKERLYYSSQGRYCCFCSEKLHEHQGAYDVEHLIAKDGKKALIFALRNLALCCKPCNGSKNSQRIRVFPIDDDIDDVQDGSDKYMVVHPYFDEWQNHLTVDEYGRIVAIDGTGLTKGRRTISMFGLHRKNAMALADHFDVFSESAATKKEWLSFYTQLASEDPGVRKRKFQSFLRHLVALPQDPAADELRELLKPMLAPQ